MLRTLIGMGSAALTAAVPYPGKVTRISHKGQRNIIKYIYIFLMELLHDQTWCYGKSLACCLFCCFCHGHMQGVCVCVIYLCVCVWLCVCVCACASAFCLNKTSLLDCALKTKDLLFGDYRGNHWYVCYREHFVCFLVVFHDLFPFRFVRFLLWTSSFHFFSFYLVPWKK